MLVYHDDEPQLLDISFASVRAKQREITAVGRLARRAASRIFAVIMLHPRSPATAAAVSKAA